MYLTGRPVMSRMAFSIQRTSATFFLFVRVLKEVLDQLFQVRNMSEHRSLFFSVAVKGIESQKKLYF